MPSGERRRAIVFAGSTRYNGFAAFTTNAVRIFRWIRVLPYSKHIGELSENSWSPPPMDKRNPEKSPLRCRSLERERISDGEGSMPTEWIEGPDFPNSHSQDETQQRKLPMSVSCAEVKLTITWFYHGAISRQRPRK
ncbi:hypothetical protein EVAR_25429_1 [Eumeta japonica]|uniref:Uncharacterized protein n=1 Tax=Eumeta variegata TaxID=151549 RepID=A0A4C1V6F9_EUMVA|nr:hypothetical protein EVAR_25429_1 [Eumeta japonica]